MNPSLGPQQDALVYFTYGKDCYHQEARFSIISALLLSPEQTPAFSIAVYTDRADFFLDLPVQVHSVSAAQAHAWQGPHGYNHRSKHEVMRLALAQYRTAIFIDSDTYFTQAPQALFARTGPGKLLVNVIAASKRTQSSALMLNLSRQIEQLGLNLETLQQTNSGVMGIHHDDAGLLDESLRLMDELYLPSGQHYTMEEFALALAGQRRQLQLNECPDLLHHYWSRKAIYRAKVLAYLGKHPTPLQSPSASNDLALVTPTLPKPPASYRLQSKLLAFSLAKAYRQLFIEIRYGLYPYSNEFDRACLTAWLDKARQNAEEKQPGFLLEPALRAVLRRLPTSLRQSVREHYLPSAH